jgi:hypothetical protein
MEPEYYYFFAEQFYNSYVPNHENNNPDTTGQAESENDSLDIYAP